MAKLIPDLDIKVNIDIDTSNTTDAALDALADLLWERIWDRMGRRGLVVGTDGYWQPQPAPITREQP